VASAQAKLERVMPANLKRRVRAIDETVALDLARADATADSAALVVLSQAAQARQRVHLHYRTAQRGASERDFDPYGLAWRGGRWYAVGHCHLRGGVRSFRLDRIEQVHAVPASFGRPDDFNALAHLVFSMATLPRAHAIEVLLHADLATARRATFEPSACSSPSAMARSCSRRPMTSTGSRANCRACRSASRCATPRRCASHCATTPTACSISQCRSAPWARWRQRGGPRVLGAPLQTPV
jgi:hypothetical protein